MKIIGIIPARYKSSRFPGKPLADILGKPMIVRVHENAAKVPYFDEVLIATDDDRIAETCRKFDIEPIMTREDHKTGTDRVAEVAEKRAADLYVNIQGDEPMLESEIISAAIKPFIENYKENFMVTNLMAPITSLSELLSADVPKVVVNEKSDAVYLSRLPIPYPKETRDIVYYKQVCVYGFLPDSLEKFRTLNQGPSESAEGIELLRFIENGINVRMIKVSSDSMAVDTPSDLEKVRCVFSEKNEER